MKKSPAPPDNNDDNNIFSDSRRRNSGEYVSEDKKRKSPALMITLISLAVVIALAGIGSFTAYSLLHRPLSPVASVSASEISDSTMRLSWEKVERADGYHIYMCKNGGDDFDLYKSIEDPDVLTHELSDLDQATPYSFYITAFNRYVESENSAVLKNACTLPAQPSVELSSEEKGMIRAKWSKNEKADGYVLQYKRDGEEYTDEHTIRIEGNDRASLDIVDLEPEERYTVRVYAYLNKDSELKGAFSNEKSIEVFQNVIESEIPVTDPGIDPSKPMIAFSFDDGPMEEASTRILDTLEKYGAKATFFMVGCYVESNEENLKKKAALGMELGNHTWNHSHYGDDVSAGDIRDCSETIYDMTGKYPTAFRSPGGMTTDAILSECEAEGMPVYYWSIDTRDWENRDADAIYDAVMDHVQDGDIILMHEIYDSTADAVEKMVPELIKQGYQIVTCHDLIAAKTGEEPSAGKEYISAR